MISPKLLGNYSTGVHGCCVHPNQQKRDERRRLWRSNRRGAQQVQNSGRKTPGKERAAFFERIQKTLRIARKSGVFCETGQKKIPESVSLVLVSRDVFGFVADGWVCILKSNESTISHHGDE